MNECVCFRTAVEENGVTVPQMASPASSRFTLGVRDLKKNIHQPRRKKNIFRFERSCKECALKKIGGLAVFCSSRACPKAFDFSFLRISCYNVLTRAYASNTLGAF